MIAWNRVRPFVAKSLTVDVQVRRPDLLAIGIAMWRTAEIEPGENHDLPSPILVSAFAQVDPSPAQVEKKRLAPID